MGTGQPAVGPEHRSGTVAGAEGGTCGPSRARLHVDRVTGGDSYNAHHGCNPVPAPASLRSCAQAREKARQTTCVSNMKQLGYGLTMYSQDYDETLPFGYRYSDDRKLLWWWQDDIRPYVKN